MHNIVQAEFFHVGGGSSTLEMVEIESLGRILDHSPIKTVVRFYDEGEFVTAYALRSQAIELHNRALYTQPVKSRSWYEMLFSTLFGYSYGQTVEPGERLACVRDAFEAIAYTSKVIAVELPDYSFRPMHDNELYDLLTSVNRAKDAWIFVFKHNELCAKQNKLIASVP